MPVTSCIVTIPFQGKEIYEKIKCWNPVECV